MKEWVELAEMVKLIALKKKKDFGKFNFYFEIIIWDFAKKTWKKLTADFGIWWKVLYGIIKIM